MWGGVMAQNVVLLGHLKINSIRNKFEALKEIVFPHFDIMLISETKLDNTFPKASLALMAINYSVKTEIALAEGFAAM